MKPLFESEPLSEAHRLDGFSSGKQELDVWLKQSGLHAQAIRTARTFVWHRGNRQVVAYFSLAAHLVCREDLPGTVGRGSRNRIPAVLLARLALDSALHRRGLGAELLWDALSRTVAAADLAAARVVVVDAIDDVAATFYARYGFITIPGTTWRLVQKISDVAAALEHR